MSVAQDYVAGVENNYLKSRHFLCKISPNEIVRISEYMVENVCPSDLTKLFIFFHD
jgi:hypothetical protein